MAGHDTGQPQFCLHYGEGNEAKVRRAFDVLKDGATIVAAPAPCTFRPLMTALIDRFGVHWCLYV